MRRKSYNKNGVRIVRFPGGRIAKFHKPGTVAYTKGVAKRRAAGRRVAKLYGFAKKRRPVKSNPKRRVKKHMSSAEARQVFERYNRIRDREIEAESEPGRTARNEAMLRRMRGNPKRSNRKTYDPISRKMVRVKPLRALMGGTIKKKSSKGWAKMKKGADGVWGANPRVSKTELLYVVQGNYGQGWEDIAASPSWTEARDDIRAYRENEGGNYRLIKRRVKKETNPKRKLAHGKKAHKSKKSWDDETEAFLRSTAGMSDADFFRAHRAHEIKTGNLLATINTRTGRVTRFNPCSKTKKRRNPSDAFNVYLGRKLIDTVFATKGSYTAAEMKKSLVNHDGYDSRITVKKARK